MLIINADLPTNLDELKKVAEKSFSSTPDSSLDQWFSFKEMEKLIKESRGICLKAINDENKIIGMTFAQQESPVNGLESKEKWVIVIAAVSPENTGKGIGSKLLTILEEEVKKTGASKLFVYTNKDDKIVADFYRKNGYEDAGWIKDYQYGKNNSAIFLLKYL